MVTDALSGERVQNRREKALRRLGWEPDGNLIGPSGVGGRPGHSPELGAGCVQPGSALPPQPDQWGKDEVCASRAAVGRELLRFSLYCGISAGAVLGWLCVQLGLLRGSPLPLLALRTELPAHRTTGVSPTGH